MSQSEKPWHFGDDCLDPLAHGLLAIARSFHEPFDLAEADRFDAECRQIRGASVWYPTQARTPIVTSNYQIRQDAYTAFTASIGELSRLTDAERKRLDEVHEQRRAQTDPPSASDVDSLYRQYRVEMAVEWLKLNVSVEYADDFKRTLLDAKERFAALENKACQIINGEAQVLWRRFRGSDATIYVQSGKPPAENEIFEAACYVRYPIQRLMVRHYELLREQFLDEEYHPEREKLPDDLLALEVEILDEYAATEDQLREAGNYLLLVSEGFQSPQGRPAHFAGLKAEPAPNENTPAAPKTESPPDSQPDEMPALSDRQYLILKTLLMMKATTADARQTTAKIVEKAEGKVADPVQFKKDISSLKDAGFLNTKEGRGGGCWLTTKGRRLAERLNG